MITIALAAGFLLCGYEFIRAASNSIYIEIYGGDKIAYAMVAGTVFTAIFLYCYGWLITWIGTRRTLLFTSLFSSTMMVCCYLALQRGIRPAAMATYALREAYIVIVIEQYWSLINSTLKEGHAKKLNGPITGVGSLGAIAGGLMVKRLAEPMGTGTMLIFAAVSLLPAAICSELSYDPKNEPAPSERERGKKSLALRLFLKSSYLRRIGLLIVLTQVISTVLDLRFFALVGRYITDMDARTAYIGSFYAMLNTSAFVLQFVVAPILLTYVSLRFIHPAIPVIHVATAVMLIIKPSLLTGGLAYLLFKAFDYSIFRAGKEIFYIPLSFDSRYRAKEVIDSFGYRASKGGAAGLASLAVFTLGSVPGVAYALTAMFSALGWMAVVRKLVRQHDSILKQSPEGAQILED